MVRWVMTEFCLWESVIHSTNISFPSAFLPGKAAAVRERVPGPTLGQPQGLLLCSLSHPVCLHTQKCLYTGIPGSLGTL